ncbi:hypothetical protein PROFUN_12096, partial [Planoprotostelium fungivorum]
MQTGWKTLLLFPFIRNSPGDHFSRNQEQGPQVRQDLRKTSTTLSFNILSLILGLVFVSSLLHQLPESYSTKVLGPHLARLLLEDHFKPPSTDHLHQLQGKDTLGLLISLCGFFKSGGTAAGLYGVLRASQALARIAAALGVVLTASCLNITSEGLKDIINKAVDERTRACMAPFNHIWTEYI